MGKRKKVIAFFILSVYTFLLFLAISPLHYYLFHKTNNAYFVNLSTASFQKTTGFKNLQQCPLCNFLNLRQLQAMVCALLFSLALLWYLVFAREGRVPHLKPIRYYYALAPPINIS